MWQCPRDEQTEYRYAPVGIDKWRLTCYIHVWSRTRTDIIQSRSPKPPHIEFFMPHLAIFQTMNFNQRYPPLKDIHIRREDIACKQRSKHNNIILQWHLIHVSNPTLTGFKTNLNRLTTLLYALCMGNMLKRQANHEIATGSCAVHETASNRRNWP